MLHDHLSLGSIAFFLFKANVDVAISLFMDLDDRSSGCSACQCERTLSIDALYVKLGYSTNMIGISTGGSQLINYDKEQRNGHCASFYNKWNNSYHWSKGILKFEIETDCSEFKIYINGDYFGSHIHMLNPSQVLYIGINGLKDANLMYYD